jgi:ketosteroid isomerase-like protein
MSQENVDAARRLFKAVEERDLAGVLATYDPDVVIREAASLLYGGAAA